MNDIEYISIIVPVYNSAGWLRRCLQSIAEACDANCEVVVVNDGSTDESLAIAREFEDTDPRFTVIDQPNKGVSEARHAGLDASNGDSIIFFDSDDVMPIHAISDLRRVSEPDTDIVVGNISWLGLKGEKRLSISGDRRVISGAEYAHMIMRGEIDFYTIGKKFRRSLFDAYISDSSPILAGLFQRAMLLSLACKATKVLIAPSAHTYIHVTHPWSISSMIQVRPEGLERLWHTATTLPLPKDDLALWGLDLIDETLLRRGIPFESDFSVAVEVGALCRNMELDEHHQEILRLLSSKKKRLAWCRQKLKEGKLTVPAPHLSFIVIAHNEPRRVKRTLKSIFDTGFRNIEIVLIDDGSNPTAAAHFNALAIFYPRITLIKNREQMGVHYARKQALAAVTGMAVMFIDPGDSIIPEGVLEALNMVDNGMDIAFMGTSYSGRMGLFGQKFDPTTNVPMHNKQLTAFDNFASLGSATRAVHGAIIRIDHVKRSGLNDTDTGIKIDFKTLMMLQMLTDNVSVGATAVVGYHRVTHRSRSSTLDYCIRKLRIGNDIIQLLEMRNQVTTARLRSLSYGITTILSRALSQLLLRPLTGRLRARKAVRRLVNTPEFEKFYTATGTPAPSEDILLGRATDYLDRDRSRVTGEAITGY